MTVNDKIRGKSEFANPTNLVPYERNSRIHSDEQIAMISESISKFGFIKPIICDENKMVLAGHGARLAAIALGMDRIPVRIISGLSDVEKRAYVIADNRSSELSTWDWELLTVELTDLKSIDMDLKPLGFPDFGNENTHERQGANVTIGEGRFLLQVEFESEGELQKLFSELKSRGFDNMKVLE